MNRLAAIAAVAIGIAGVAVLASHTIVRVLGLDPVQTGLSVGVLATAGAYALLDRLTQRDTLTVRCEACDVTVEVSGDTGWMVGLRTLVTDHSLHKADA